MAIWINMVRNPYAPSKRWKQIADGYYAALFDVINSAFLHYDQSRPPYTLVRVCGHDDSFSLLCQLLIDDVAILQVLGQFIARAVADDCLPPKFVASYKGKVETPHARWGGHNTLLLWLIPGDLYSACPNTVKLA